MVAVRPRIMIIDDTPENLGLLEKMLRESGFLPLSFTRGDLALEAARKTPPDLILLDIKMPIMNGYEVCEQIRASEELSNIPIIFLSAMSAPEDKLKGFSAGGVDYIAKPFHVAEVEARIRAHLQIKSLQQEIDEKYQQLKKLETLRENLTHMMVHDLRTPLSVVSMSLDYLLSYGHDVTRGYGRAMMTNASTATKNMVEMVNQILDISAMEAGKMPINKERRNLRPLVQEVIDEVRNLAAEQGLRLSITGNDAGVFIDAGLFKRVIENLFSNAFKYAPPDSVVEVRVSRSGASMQLSVSDRGPGIPEEFREKIFEKFGQVSSGRERGRRSSGIGLTFCQLAVEAHDGKIGVDCGENGGSTFWIEIPIEANVAEHPAPTQPPA